MTVKLIKRTQADSVDNKPERPLSPDELMLKTQRWVQEFRAGKARREQSLRALIERA